MSVVRNMPSIAPNNSEIPINDLKKSVNPITFNATKEDELMVGLIAFFQEPYNLNLMLSVILGSSKISLRALDWAVTNYAKHHSVNYTIKKRNHSRNFSVYNHYKSQLKSHSKKQFDPFCRRNRIYFEYEPNVGIETTVGQLNFFRWAIENKVLEWVQNHLDEIVDDMNLRASKPTKDDNGDKELKKKRELSVAASKSISQHDVKITLKFDI